MSGGKRKREGEGGGGEGEGRGGGRRMRMERKGTFTMETIKVPDNDDFCFSF